MDDDNSGWIKRDVCGQDNCRSRRYRYENGHYWCQNGHRFHGNLVSANEQDEDVFGPSGRAYRKQSEGREKVKQHFEGRKAFEHYLLCYQLLLRKQLWYLTQTQRLPAELEGVVVDLWALRLSKLQDRVPDVSDNDGGSHLYSSQSEATTTDAEASTDAESRLLKRGRRSSSTPTLLDALGMCHLGMYCLRLPITTGDIIKWVASNDLIYYRAIQHLPADMKSRLPAQYCRALDPETVLKPTYLQRSVIDLVFLFERDHQVTFPPLNRPLLTFRLVRELALPLEVYAAACRLASFVGFLFEFPSISSGRIQNTDMPETQLIAALIVAVKLLYPFDEVVRHPRTASEPAAVAMDWTSWARRTKQYHDTIQNPEISTFEDLLQTDETSVFSMSGEKLDQYLDWYQKIWADETIPDQAQNVDFRKALFAMFPAGPPLPDKLPQEGMANEQIIQDAQTARLKGVQQDLESRHPMTDSEERDMDEPVSRPGSFYTHYRTVEELPPNAKVFYEEAANMTGLSLYRLVRAVFTTERKLSNWKDEQRMKRKGKDKV